MEDNTEENKVKLDPKEFLEREGERIAKIILEPFGIKNVYIPNPEISRRRKTLVKGVIEDLDPESISAINDIAELSEERNKLSFHERTRDILENDEEGRTLWGIDTDYNMSDVKRAKIGAYDQLDLAAYGHTLSLKGIIV